MQEKMKQTTETPKT